MELIPNRLEVEANGIRHHSACRGFPDTVGVGPLEVHLSPGAGGGVLWSAANRGDQALSLRSVALVYQVEGAVEPLSMFRHGYQSWSPTGVATFGVDVDPSTVADFEFLQGVHHADQRRANAGELRSEWVTVLRSADQLGQPRSHRPAVLVGFAAGTDHDGTLRLRRDARGTPELWAEAFFGGAVVAPGEQRRLHPLVLDARPEPDATHKLAQWSQAVGIEGGARASAPYRLGWCSWYQYFHQVTEDHLRANLAVARSWPFDVFQLDDGFQREIGDWLHTNSKFPSSLDVLAHHIASEGHIPGLWLAPFLAAPRSELARTHPDWIARAHGAPVPDPPAAMTGHQPLRTWWNPSWEGGEKGFMYGIDTTNPEVLEHLEATAAALVDAGFGYLKVDFTFSPSIDGVYADPTKTPAQRVRAGYEALRRGAGEDTFILGCGVPLSHVVGLVDGNRIGQDVAPLWDLKASDEIIPGYLDVQPATQLAYANTVARSFMHRRLWCNDPDCLMLRTVDTALSPAAARTWAMTVGLSGGMVVVSDDLSLLDAEAKSLLQEVAEIGRRCDAQAAQGAGPQVPDLMDAHLPTVLESAGYRLEVDPIEGTSRLHEGPANGDGLLRS